MSKDDLFSDSQTASYNQVVNTGGITGSGQLDFSQIDDMANLLAQYDESIKPQGVQSDYPALNRGVQIGSGSTRTLGTDPIFSAGSMMFPFSVYDAREQAKALAKVKQKEDYIKALDYKIYETKDKLKNVSWVNTQIDTINNDVKPFIDALGEINGRIAYMNSPKYREYIVQTDALTKNLDSFFDSASKIQSDVSKGMYVPIDAQRATYDFFGTIENPKKDITVEDIKKLNSSALKSYGKISEMTQPYAEVVNKYANDVIAKDPRFRDTDSNDVYLKTTEEGLRLNRKEDVAMVENIVDTILNTQFYGVPEKDKPSRDMLRASLENQLVSKYKEELITVGNANLAKKAYWDNWVNEQERNANEVVVTPVNKDIYTITGVDLTQPQSAIDEQGLKTANKETYDFKNVKVWNYEDKIAPVVQIGEKGLLVKGYQIIESTDDYGNKKYIGVGKAVNVDKQTGKVETTSETVFFPATAIAGGLSSNKNTANAYPSNLKSPQSVVSTKTKSTKTYTKTYEKTNKNYTIKGKTYSLNELKNMGYTEQQVAKYKTK